MHLVKLTYINVNGRHVEVPYSVVLVPSDDTFGPHVELTPTEISVSKVILPIDLIEGLYKALDARTSA